MKIISLVLLSFISTAGCRAPAGSRLASSDSNGSDRYADFRKFIDDDMQRANAAGMAVALIENGSVTFMEGFGNTKFDGAEPIGIHTLFDVQSVTKTVTAAAAMKLVSEGKLELDAPVIKYIPYFSVVPFDPSTVTVRQVLNMTAGYPSGFATNTAVSRLERPRSVGSEIGGALWRLFPFILMSPVRETEPGS